MPRPQNARTYDLGHWERMQLDLALDARITILRVDELCLGCREGDGCYRDPKCSPSGDLTALAELRQVLTTDGPMSITVRDPREE